MAVSFLIGALPSVRAQQDAPASPPAATTSSTSVQTAASDQGAANAQPQTPGNGSSATSKPGKSQVCFKLTMRCVDAKPQAGKGGATSTDPAAAQQPLNLNAPDIRTVVSPEELKEPLPSSSQIVEEQDTETVSVKGEKNAPDVPGGFGALWWALNHPSQAWRIFAPAQ
jgi:hypothetical protein